MLPEPWTVVHSAYVLNDPYEEDAHGNPKGHYLDPVNRKAVAIDQAESTEPVTGDYVNRTVTELRMAVRDPSLYGAQDRVSVDGVSYLVQGEPASELKGLFPAYNKMLGGVVRLRRVT